MSLLKYLVLSVMLGVCGVNAQTPIKVAPPTGFEEGTETRISAAQLKDLEKWATNSMIRLKKLLDDTKDKHGFVALDSLLAGFSDIREKSEEKRSEILMRFVLNRGLKIAELLKTQIDPQNKLANDVLVRILKRSAEMAIEYYESDYEYVGGQGRLRNLSDRDIDYASFGVDYVIFLMTIMESMPDISAQYTIARLALGLFQFDLYRDQNRQKMVTPIIMQLQPLVDKYPESVKDDLPQYLVDLRVIRKGFLDGINFMIDPKNFMNLSLKFAYLADKEAIQERKIRGGDRVITLQGHWGTVLELKGGQAVVRIDSNPGMDARQEDRTVAVSELSRKLDDNEGFKGFKPGMKRRDYQCEEFEVAEVFANGMIRAYYKKHKKSFALQIYPDGIPYSVRYKERGRECDI